MKKIDKLIEFIKFTNKFQQTTRMIHAVGEDRNENDAEHSYQVAITCWYLISEFNLDLDIELVLKYAIVHDLPEAITGDYYFEIDKKTKTEKEDKELKAIEKISEDFPGFKELKQLLTDYNNKADAESRFVNATEKILPVINIYLDDGRTWKEEGMSWDILVPNKDAKTAISELPAELWAEFKVILGKSKLLPKD